MTEATVTDEELYRLENNMDKLAMFEFMINHTDNPGIAQNVANRMEQLAESTKRYYDQVLMKYGVKEEDIHLYEIQKGTGRVMRKQ